MVSVHAANGPKRRDRRRADGTVVAALIIQENKKKLKWKKKKKISQTAGYLGPDFKQLKSQRFIDMGIGVDLKIVTLAYVWCVRF